MWSITFLAMKRSWNHKINTPKVNIQRDAISLASLVQWFKEEATEMTEILKSHAVCLELWVQLLLKLIIAYWVDCGTRFKLKHNIEHLKFYQNRARWSEWSLLFGILFKYKAFSFRKLRNIPLNRGEWVVVVVGKGGGGGNHHV